MQTVHPHSVRLCKIGVANVRLDGNMCSVSPYFDSICAHRRHIHTSCVCMSSSRLRRSSTWYWITVLVCLPILCCLCLVVWLHEIIDSEKKLRTLFGHCLGLSGFPSAYYFSFVWLCEFEMCEFNPLLALCESLLRN